MFVMQFIFDRVKIDINYGETIYKRKIHTYDLSRQTDRQTDTASLRASYVQLYFNNA
jgi:hypothetical protein